MRYRVADDVAWLQGGESSPDACVYAVKLPDGRPVALNDSASAVWLLAVAGEDPVEAIVAETDLPRSQVEGDITSFLSALIEQGLLTAAPTTPDVTEGEAHDR
jgi:hypothetical protein